VIDRCDFRHRRRCAGRGVHGWQAHVYPWWNSRRDVPSPIVV